MHTLNWGISLAASRRRDSENETAGESHAQKFIHGHPWHASHTKGEAAKRELESINKRAASEEIVSLQVHLCCPCMISQLVVCCRGFPKASDALWRCTAT